MKKVKVVLWTRQDAKNEYPIKLRFFSESEGKYKYNSLKIGLSAVKYFNEKEGLVRSIHPKHIEYNSIIKEALKKNTTEPSINTINGNASANDSFMMYLLEYYNQLIDNGSIGNGKKFKVLYNKLEGFLENKDLKFSQFDIQFVKNFHFYLKGEELNDNTIQIYLNKLKRIYNIARQEKKITGDNLWEFYKYSGHQTVSKALTVDEFDIFSLSELKDEKLARLRREALILFFSNGMRIGDLILLKWKSIENKHINYNMRKTKKLMNVFISMPLAHLLCELISKKGKYSEDILGANYELQINFINTYSWKHSNEYIVDYMKDLVFKGEFQKYNKVQNITANWNRSLKLVCDKLKLRPISSHVMRHSFSSLLLGGGKTDIKMVSQSLGHSSIGITNKYIRTLSTPEMDAVTGSFYNDFVLRNQGNNVNTEIPIAKDVIMKNKRT